MSLDKAFLQYSKRRYGMDHELYPWSMLSQRPKIQWPNGKKVALWVNVCLQFFPMNQEGKPFKVPGGMTMPYPDLRHYTLRDYGNRIGLFRFFKAFDRYNICPTYAMNTRLAERNPYLLSALKDRSSEIACHGYHMDALHYGGQDLKEEEALIDQSLTSMRELTGQDVIGWLSPARSESENTPDLLAKHGIQYFSDWVNDDLPYSFSTQNGPLIAMPLSNELDDTYILQNNLHSEQSYVEQVCDAYDFLSREASNGGGRILALNIHPWMLGQPHRIGKLEQVLEYITSHDDVWSASAATILNSFLKN